MANVRISQIDENAVPMTATNIYHPAYPGALNRDAIAALIAGGAPPLLSGYVDLATQLQPNGFDLTLRAVAGYTPSAPGRMGVDDAERALPPTAELPFGAGGWVSLTLPPGPYLVTFNEVVSLPHNLMALCRPRSSLLRSGVALHTAVWDAGYAGRSQALLVVHHPAGWRVRRDARIAQMVFLPLAAPDDVGYAGRYQGENV